MEKSTITSVTINHQISNTNHPPRSGGKLKGTINGLESKEYFCGEPIFMANFTLVGRDDSKFAIEKEFFSRFVVRTELTCDSYIDKKYYSNQTAMEGVEMLCYRCGENLSERPDIIASILKERENFHCVLPT